MKKYMVLALLVMGCSSSASPQVVSELVKTPVVGDDDAGQGTDSGDPPAPAEDAGPVEPVNDGGIAFYDAAGCSEANPSGCPSFGDNCTIVGYPPSGAGCGQLGGINTRFDAGAWVMVQCTGSTHGPKNCANEQVTQINGQYVECCTW